MEPGVVLAGEVRHLANRIEVTGVHVAGRGEQDRRPAAQLLQRRLDRLEVDAPGRVSGKDRGPASP